jgi:hypothetical protein
MFGGREKGSPPGNPDPNNELEDGDCPDLDFSLLFSDDFE